SPEPSREVCRGPARPWVRPEASASASAEQPAAPAPADTAAVPPAQRTGIGAVCSIRLLQPSPQNHHRSSFCPVLAHVLDRTRALPGNDVVRRFPRRVDPSTPRIAGVFRELEIERLPVRVQDQVQAETFT